MNTENQAIIARILTYEGVEFVNHSSDRGGPTKYGVTQRTLAAYRKHPVDAHDVAVLTKSDAAEICEAMFVNLPNFGTIDDMRLRGFVVDWGWASGPQIATRGVQRAVNNFFGRAVLAIDGVFGGHSQQTVNSFASGTLFPLVYGQRLRQTFRFVTDNPEQAVFAAGWANRLADYIERT